MKRKTKRKILDFTCFSAILFSMGLGFYAMNRIGKMDPGILMPCFFLTICIAIVWAYNE